MIFHVFQILTSHTVRQIFLDKLPITKSYIKWTRDYGRTWESRVTPRSARVGYKSSVTLECGGGRAQNP